jgi:hypothetical protein|tara:strand:- start:181 stop:420 length:240 start_codon:yes stop_codon:yes gene_type:complete
MSNFEQQVDKVYRYLKAKHHYNKDFWREQQLSRSEVRNKMQRGDTSIDGVSINGNGNLGVDTGDYGFQLKWEFDYDTKY